MSISDTPTAASGGNHRITQRGRIAALALAVSLAGGLTACSSGFTGSNDPAVSGLGPDSAPQSGGDCTAAFELATAGASLDDLTLVPANWPEPPAGATLCATANELDGSLQSAGYLAPMSAMESLTYYLDAVTAVDASWAPFDGIQDNGIVGLAGTITYQIDAQDGQFTITFIGDAE